MNLFAFLPVEESVQICLTLVLSILSLFTTVFLIWSWIKPSDFVKLMLTRTFSWWVIFTLYVAFFCMSSNWGCIGLALLALAAQWELQKRIKNFGFNTTLMLWSAGLTVLLFYWIYKGRWVEPLLMLPLLHFTIISIYAINFIAVDRLLAVSAWGIWSFFVGVYGFAHLGLLFRLPALQNSPAGAPGLVLYYIFLTQFNDVLQFIWGTSFGKKKISPVISPNKTWTGFLGGALTTTMLAVFLRMLTPFSVVQAMIVGMLLAITGFYGDLLISALKRNLKIKDMGSLIPGHGGLLDRIDSITLSSVVYFYLLFFWFYSNSLQVGAWLQ